MSCFEFHIVAQGCRHLECFIHTVQWMENLRSKVVFAFTVLHVLWFHTFWHQRKIRSNWKSSCFADPDSTFPHQFLHHLRQGANGHGSLRLAQDIKESVTWQQGRCDSNCSDSQCLGMHADFGDSVQICADDNHMQSSSKMPQLPRWIALIQFCKLRSASVLMHLWLLWKRRRNIVTDYLMVRRSSHIECRLPWTLDYNHSMLCYATLGMPSILYVINYDYLITSYAL